MKKLRVLALMDERRIPPDEPTDEELVSADWKTEYDVTATLEEMGHELVPCGVQDDLGVIRKAISETTPHIAFNLLEAFDEITTSSAISN